RGGKHHAVGQQRRPVPPACGVEIASGGPTPAGRTIQFRARGSDETAVNSPSGKHHAVRQQGPRMLHASGVEIAGDSPVPAGGDGRVAVVVNTLKRLNTKGDVPDAVEELV